MCVSWVELLYSVIFTLKKFRLIGARARIKKTLQIIEDLIPIFQAPYDLQQVPTYLGFLIRLNTETSRCQFTEDEIQQLEGFRRQLKQWNPDDVPRLRQPFSSSEKQLKKRCCPKKSTRESSLFSSF